VRERGARGAGRGREREGGGEARGGLKLRMRGGLKLRAKGVWM